MKVIIIGYGNPLRGDDGVGWYVAGRLADIADEKSVQVLACHQLTPEMAATIAPASLVIFVDAECGQTPGLIRRSTVVPSVPIGAKGCRRPLGHIMSPEQILDIARDLFNATPSALLTTVCGQSFAHGEDLTPVVQRSCDQVILQIRQLIERLRSDQQIHDDGEREIYGYA